MKKFHEKKPNNEKKSNPNLNTEDGRRKTRAVCNALQKACDTGKALANSNADKACAAAVQECKQVLKQKNTKKKV